MDEKEKIEKALVKVALGFQVAEVTEEYAEVDGEWKLTKRKRTKKDVPPDLKAVQLLLAENGATYTTMSDEELEQEKKRLLAELSTLQEKEKTDGHVRVEKKKKTAKAEKKQGDRKDDEGR